MNEFGRQMRYHRGALKTTDMEGKGVSSRTINYIEQGSLPTVATLGDLLIAYDSDDTRLTGDDKIKLVDAIMDARRGGK
jgi:hypothetical protein